MEHLTIDWQQYGLLGATIGTVLIGIITGTGYMLHRLFGKDGILVRVSDRHVAFVDESRNVMERCVTQCGTLSVELLGQQKAHNDLSARMCDRIDAFIVESRDPAAPYSTVALHEAGLHACDLAEKVCATLDVDCQSEIREMRRKLTR